MAIGNIVPCVASAPVPTTTVLQISEERSIRNRLGLTASSAVLQHRAAIVKLDTAVAPWRLHVSTHERRWADGRVIADIRLCDQNVVGGWLGFTVAAALNISHVRLPHIGISNNTNREQCGQDGKSNGRLQDEVFSDDFKIRNSNKMLKVEDNKFVTRLSFYIFHGKNTLNALWFSHILPPTSHQYHKAAKRVAYCVMLPSSLTILHIAFHGLSSFGGDGNPARTAAQLEAQYRTAASYKCG